jgi:ABC-type multidrug transport system permease subunit
MHAVQAHENTERQEAMSPPNSIRELQETILFTPRHQKSVAASSSSKDNPRPVISKGSAEILIQDHLQILIEGFDASKYSETMKLKFDDLTGSVPAREEAYSSLRRAFSMPAFTGLRSGTRASWWSQFQILSGRTFKNLYRNPLLLQAHYITAIGAAVACGILFWKIPNDISGFQNRMGVFFFVCTLFGFGCMSSMQAFAAERKLFVKERANRYYSPYVCF